MVREVTYVDADRVGECRKRLENGPLHERKHQQPIDVKRGLGQLTQGGMWPSLRGEGGVKLGPNATKEKTRGQRLQGPSRPGR